VADALGQLGDPKAAVSGVRRAIAALEPLAADVQDVESRHALARSFKTLGGWLAVLRDLEGHLAMARRSVEISEGLAAADPLDMGLRHELAVCALQQGLAHLRLGQFEAALASFRRAGTLWASMVDADPSNVQARWMRGLNFNLIGATFRQMGGHEREAIAVHLEALPLLEGLSRTDPANETYYYNVANTLQLVGNAYGTLARRTSPGAGRNRARTAACDWYARSDAAFEAMRQRGKLTGAFVPDAEAVRAERTRCGGEPGKAASPGSTR
jgi:tetratricopeptide (TPR) repeat protein